MQVRIGTRGSQLALVQADKVKHRLLQLDPLLDVVVVPISTVGDRDLQSPLYDLGGKGVFIKEIEQALLSHQVDLAVHSLKDITSELAVGLELTAFLEAETTADALILKAPYTSLDALPQGAIIATGSMRRKALLKRLRADIQTMDIRGNVNTRLNKLEQGDFAGLLLSEAGLIRLHLQHKISQCFSPDAFCPAPGQGVIAIETRIGDRVIKTLCEKINDPLQCFKSETELVFLRRVGLDCRSPLGAHVRVQGNDVSLLAFVANADMTQVYEQKRLFKHAESVAAATQLADDFLDWMAHHQ